MRAESLALSNNVQLSGRKSRLARLDHGRHRHSRSRRHIHRRRHPPLPQPVRRPAGDRVIIVGYSQSARIATIAKRYLIENYASETAEPDAPQVDSLASGMRALLGATTRKPRRPTGIPPRRLIQSPRRNPLRRRRSRNHLQRRPISPRCAGRSSSTHRRRRRNRRPHRLAERPRPATHPPLRQRRLQHPIRPVHRGRRTRTPPST
jgi:hypothetical protein